MKPVPNRQKRFGTVSAKVRMSSEKLRGIPEEYVSPSAQKGYKESAVDGDNVKQDDKAETQDAGLGLFDGPQSRRTFIKTAARLGAEAVFGAAIFGRPKERAQKRRERSQSKEAKKTEQREERGKRYATGELAGKFFSDLYSTYTGISGRAGEFVTVDFRKQLQEMWQTKEQRSKGNVVVKETSAKIQKAYREDYDSSKLAQMSLENYATQIGDVIDRAKASMNWTTLAQIEGLNAQELALVRPMASSIEGRDLVAYALTELMPSVVGEFNSEVLEFLLKNAGREYIESIPAMYDPYTSFGPYQFTQYAWYDVPNPRKRGEFIRRGGSRVNAALDKGKVPHGSVSKLQGDEHHKAAFMFMIDNLCTLVNRLNKNEFDVLQRVWKKRKDDVVMYLGAAHHMPYPAVDAARRWLDNKARKEFYVSCGPHLRKYAVKTRANLNALKERAR